jgi:spore germination protein YaaH
VAPSARPSRGRRTVGAIVALVLASGAAGGLATGSTVSLTAAPTSDRPATPAFAATGYVDSGDGDVAALLRRSAATVDDVGVDGASLNAAADGIVLADRARVALAAAHAAGRPASLLVSNFDDGLGDFSPRLGARLLRSPERRAAVAAAVAAEVRSRGWDGATVDLEALDVRDRAGLVAFVGAVRAALPGDLTVDVDVPAATDPRDPGLAPFDLPALAAAADRVVVMAYDQHYIGGRPGPVAGLGWFRRSVRTALSGVPAARLRVGVAGYGYRWRRDGRTSAVTVRAARRLAGRRARWDATQAEWTARLADGSVLWWSDARSVRARTAVARDAGAAGIALWRLGAADPLDPR